MSEKCPKPLRTDIDISKPRYNQETYTGRAKHFFITAFPTKVFASSSKLEKAKEIINSYKAKKKLCISEDELWKAKQLYDSAYHPDTGELMFLPGRMSFQPFGNTLITGGMMTFYKKVHTVIFWHWTNQSFNALVNYTNRSGNANLTTEHLMKCYVAATLAAVSVALGLNTLVKQMPALIGRFVPFCSVAATNFVNIPLMRQNELTDGISVYDEQGKNVGVSKVAAFDAIGKVIFSRVVMAMPSMLTVPVIMDYFEKRGTFCRYPWSAMPLNCFYTLIILTFATPLACALFTQQVNMDVNKAEKEIRDKLKGKVKILTYNKGL